MSAARYSLFDTRKNFFYIHNNCKLSRGVTILIHNDKVRTDVKIALRITTVCIYKSIYMCILVFINTYEVRCNY